MGTDSCHNCEGAIEAAVKVYKLRCDKLAGEVAFLRGVVGDCLVFGGRVPSSPKAELKIHGIDFVVSMLDALQSAYAAVDVPVEIQEQQPMESAIREKIKKEMDKSNERD